MPSPYAFSDPRLAKLDGFLVEIEEAHERADIILNRPAHNIVSMPQRDQLRLAFETLDEDSRVRVIVIRALGEHFSSGGNIGGFMEASPEHVSKLAWNIAGNPVMEHWSHNLEHAAVFVLLRRLQQLLRLSPHSKRSRQPKTDNRDRGVTPICRRSR